MSAASIKAYRHRAIMQLLAKHVVTTQAQLVRLLAARKIPTTQATVTRDLAVLPVVQYRGRWLTQEGYLAALEKVVVAGPWPNGGQVKVTALGYFALSEREP